MHGSCRGSCKICTHEMDEVKAAADKIIAKMGNLCTMGSGAMKEQSARQRFYMLGAVPPPPETEGTVGGAPLRKPSSQAEGSRIQQAKNHPGESQVGGDSVEAYGECGEKSADATSTWEDGANEVPFTQED